MHLLCIKRQFGRDFTSEKLITQSGLQWPLCSKERQLHFFVLLVI